MKHLKSIKVFENNEDNSFDRLSQMSNPDFYEIQNSNKEYTILSMVPKIRTDLIEKITNVIGSDRIFSKFHDTFHVHLHIKLEISNKFYTFIIKRMDDEWLLMYVLYNNYSLLVKCDREEGVLAFFYDLKKLFKLGDI
jgi:hypothetical protein